MIENGKVFSGITCIFGGVQPPRSGPSETALRLRSLPEGRPPQAILFYYWSKFIILIENYHYFVIFCDIYQCIFDQISMAIMKNTKYSKHFRKICKNHLNIFDKKNSRKKKKKKENENFRKKENLFFLKTSVWSARAARQSHTVLANSQNSMEKI